MQFLEPPLGKSQASVAETCVHIVHTCDLEGAFPGAGLVDDVAGVLAPAVAVQAADGVLGLVPLGVEGAGVQQLVGQQPLEAQHPGRVGPQNPARHHHGPPQALTHLHVGRLHRGGVCGQGGTE